MKENELWKWICPYDPDAEVTEIDELKWAYDLALDEWAEKNLYDENGNYIDTRLIFEDESEDEYDRKEEAF